MDQIYGIKIKLVFEQNMSQFQCYHPPFLCHKTDFRKRQRLQIDACDMIV